MKRFLFVESYPHVLFGQQRTLLSLLQGCREAGIDPVVAVTAEGVFVEEVRRLKIPVSVLAYPEALSPYGGAIYGYKGAKFLRMLWQWLGYILGIRGELKSLRLDGIYCNDMRGLLTVGVAARSLGLPVLLWDKLDKPHGWMDWLQLWIVSRNLIISEAVAVKYPAWQKWVFSKKIQKVHDGADLARFADASSIRGSLPGGGEDILLAIVGTITERKGHDRIFSIWNELMHRCPRARLLVVGETTGNEADEKYRETLPNRDHARVHFLGTRQDVPGLMRSVDILLVPSRFEGAPLVIAEAMAAGVPVIGAKAGGIPEMIVDGRTGSIVEGDDPGAWTLAIIKLAESRELRQTMGKAGRERAETEFDRSSQTRKVLDLCLGMIHER